MVKKVICLCGHGVESHAGGSGACKAPARGTEGCTFEGKPIPCDCEKWDLASTEEVQPTSPKGRKSKHLVGLVGMALLRSQSQG